MDNTNWGGGMQILPHVLYVNSSAFQCELHHMIVLNLLIDKLENFWTVSRKHIHWYIRLYTLKLIMYAICVLGWCYRICKYISNTLQPYTRRKRPRGVNNALVWIGRMLQIHIIWLYLLYWNPVLIATLNY